ncbi:MAG: single-stranded DNA-binding protein [Selenomonadales bacterium]|nr:single-stranded DNA-binding protein [Selenomonadales bacterium]
MITSTTTLQDLFNLAVQTLANVQTGETFIVKDLFRGYEWNRIAKGNRTKLGAMFLAYAKEDGKFAIKAVGKTPQNQQIYEKI